METNELRRMLAKGTEIAESSGGKPVGATIVSVGDLVRIIEREHTGSFQYRGQKCSYQKLLPTLTRPVSPFKTGLAKHETLRYKEQHILKEFRTRFVAYGREAPADEIHLAILARHHGVPTRLLDWTLNPLAALYFAVEDSDLWDEKCPSCGNEDCTPVVWAVKGERHRMSDFRVHSLGRLKKRPYFIIPDHDESRAAVQASIISLWGDPKQAFEDLPYLEKIWKISILRDKSRHLLWVLHCLGITAETLFPDLDSLGRYLAWKHRRIHETDYQQCGRPQARDT
jgi:hypothetical protein